jgi:hypothetical protein
MPFQIPTDITVFSLEGLSDLRRVAFEELTSLRAANTPETITDEDLARGEELAQFVTTADERITELRNRANRFNALPAAPEPTAEPTPAPEAPQSEPSPEPAPEPVPVTASAEETGTDGGTEEPTPRRTGVQDMAPHSEQPQAPAPVAFENHTILAAADIPGLSTGSELASWKDVAKAFMARTRAYSGKKTPTQHSVVEIRREFGPEFTFDNTDDQERTAERLAYVTDETRLEGGSLVAANGWCSPSENLYSTCLQTSTDGLISLPEVTAPRGGINHNQGIEFDAIFGSGTGFGNIFTEADIISGVTKTCIEIPCPPFVDDRLKAAALCLTGSILQNRTYPEFVSTFIQGAVAVFAHVINRDIIEDLVAGSTSVNLGNGDVFASDTSVVSQTLSAVEHAIVDIKYRLRLPRNASLEVVLPFWILAQYRADWSRRNGVENVNLADTQLAAWFATRGANAQYVYDWQDAFSGVSGGFGADTPTVAPPTSVQFLVYPAGTWVLARLDVIRLDSIYDSVNLAENMVTQLFQEDGYAVMRMCPLSRVYTVPICPSGATSALQEVCILAS